MSAKGAPIRMMNGLASARMQRAGGVLARAGAVAGAAALLAGCLSLGGDPPDRLYTLTPSAQAPAGASTTGDVSSAISVLEPNAPQRLAVTRVPVAIDNSSIAYLQDAVWVERPARLFQRLLAETIRSRGNRLVLSDDDLQYSAPTRLSGQLLELGYDASSSSVVARYDAVLQSADGQVLTRRFEAIVPGIAADAVTVGPALNQAANQVAAEVAEWVG
jgi:cholesterol transport system auxiliary component